MISVSILILRLALGLSFVGHGAQKLFGWFGGRGFRATAQGYGQGMGMRPGWLFALLGGGGELFGGLLLALGLLTDLGAFLIAAAMVVAIAKVTGKNGYWISKSGWEYNGLIIVVCVVIALTGPGRYSLDTLFGLDRLAAPLPALPR